MNPSTDPRAVTTKIPRRPFTEADQDHILDVTLACAYSGNPPPADYSERKDFARYIASCSDEEVNPKIKEFFASLTEEERADLFI